MVVNEDSMIYGHWPQRKVSLVRPVDGKMDEHGSCRGLDVLNSLFNNSIYMMLAQASKLLSLGEFFQVLFVVLAVEHCCIVASI